MEFLRYFFRGQEDGIPLKPYSLPHLILLAIFLYGAYAIVTKKFNIDKKENNQKLLNTFATIILIDQIVLYSWQFGSGYFSLDMSLPLYHCRIAVIFLILGILKDNRFFKTMTIFWGSLGSVLAMAIPDLYKFSFPHYTNFQFFLVHMILGWVVLDLLFVEKINLNIKDLKKVLIFSTAYNVILIIVNLIMRMNYPDVNYGYMMYAPGGFTLFNSSSLHAIVMTILFNIAGIALYKLFALKYEERNLWEISKSLAK